MKTINEIIKDESIKSAIPIVKLTKPGPKGNLTIDNKKIVKSKVKIIRFALDEGYSYREITKALGYKSKSSISNLTTSFNVERVKSFYGQMGGRYERPTYMHSRADEFYCDFVFGN